MESTSPEHLLLLEQAIATGAITLIDEDAQPISLAASFDSRCWAHLRDAEDGKIYVQELRGSRLLLQPRYLEMVGFPLISQ